MESESKGFIHSSIFRVNTAWDFRRASPLRARERDDNESTELRQKREECARRRIAKMLRLPFQTSSESVSFSTCLTHWLRQNLSMPHAIRMPI
jgi:hypothetical protein